MSGVLDMSSCFDAFEILHKIFKLSTFYKHTSDKNTEDKAAISISFPKVFDNKSE